MYAGAKAVCWACLVSSGGGVRVLDGVVLQGLDGVVVGVQDILLESTRMADQLIWRSDFYVNVYSWSHIVF